MVTRRARTKRFSRRHGGRGVFSHSRVCEPERGGDGLWANAEASWAAGKWKRMYEDMFPPVGQWEKTVIPGGSAAEESLTGALERPGDPPGDSESGVVFGRGHPGKNYPLKSSPIGG